MARSITVIPARNRQASGHRAAPQKKIRVAAYCRVSTDQEDQLHSFEAQVDYYTKYINDHENYEMAGIYADEGISGTNTKKREQFKRMIADCGKGKIDLVITKSISRFARNTQDCLMYSRKLKNLGIRTKFKNGEMHLNTFKFLGYDKDENGKLIINREQAKTVRRIYRDFLWGLNPAQIAKELEEEQVPGCLGQTKWYASTVIGILKQEKHMGDALLQKTYTADFLTKRQVKNNGEVAQVYVRDSHKGIVDKETWNAVQEEFERREKFMQKHGTDRYSYGSECYPFCEKIFCGECGSLFTRHSWKSRGIIQWQCKNHRKDGKVACTNAYVDDADLEKGFIKAFNRLVGEREKHIERWNSMKLDGTPLEKIRAGQMMEATESGQLQQYVPEAAQLVLEEITIFGAKKYEFAFLEGSRVKVSV